MNPLNFAGDVVLALVLGTLIGLEREFTKHAAGLRTNALVAVGAALFVLFSRMMPTDTGPTRVPAAIIVGIGFLGGGVILKEGHKVRGLTTAAGIWCAAAVGSLAGGGFVEHACIGTACILVVLVAFYPLDRSIDALRTRFATGTTDYCIRLKCLENAGETVRNGLRGRIARIPGAATGKLRLQHRRNHLVLVAQVAVSPENDAAIGDLVAAMMGEPGVVAATYEKLLLTAQ